MGTEASAAKGSAACALWESDDIKAAADNIKECTKKVVDMNKEVTKAKKACTNAFSKCRKEEDKVSGAISACSPANTKEKTTAKLIQANKNRAAAVILADKINAIVNGSAIGGSGSTVTCEEFITKAAEAIQIIMDAPIESSTETIIVDVTSYIISPDCSEEEIGSLITPSEDLVKAIQEIDDTIAVKQEDILVATGEEIADSELIETTAEAGETTAAGETAAAGEVTAAEETTAAVEATVAEETTVAEEATAPEETTAAGEITAAEETTVAGETIAAGETT